MIKTFTGYKGKMAAAQIGEMPFVILAKNDQHLAAIWQLIMQDTALDPSGIKRAILIESSTLLTPAAKPATT